MSPALNDVLNFIYFLSFMGGYKYFSVLMKDLEADFNGKLYYGHVYKTGVFPSRTPLTLYRLRAKKGPAPPPP